MRKDNHLGLAALIFLSILGLPVVISLGLSQTNFFNYASEVDYSSAVNLNNPYDILSANNADGTMGPLTWDGNASNVLPAEKKGKLLLKASETHTKQAQRRGQDKASLPYQSVELTITKGEVRITGLGIRNNKYCPSEEETVKGKGIKESFDHWETLNIEGPLVIDLVTMSAREITGLLSFSELAAGRYTEVRLYISSAKAALSDGTVVPLTINGNDKIIRLVRSFTISCAGTTTLTLDFDAQRSVIKAGDKYFLKPVVAKVIEEN